MIIRGIIKSYGEYIRKNPLRNKIDRMNYLKYYLDIVYKNKDKFRYKNKDKFRYKNNKIFNLKKKIIFNLKK